MTDVGGSRVVVLVARWRRASARGGARAMLDGYGVGASGLELESTGRKVAGERWGSRPPRGACCAGSSGLGMAIEGSDRRLVVAGGGAKLVVAKLSPYCRLSDRGSIESCEAPAVWAGVHSPTLGLGSIHTSEVRSPKFDIHIPLSSFTVQYSNRLHSTAVRGSLYCVQYGRTQYSCRTCTLRHRPRALVRGFAADRLGP